MTGPSACGYSSECQPNLAPLAGTMISQPQLTLKDLAEKVKSGLPGEGKSGALYVLRMNRKNRVVNIDSKLFLLICAYSQTQTIPAFYHLEDKILKMIEEEKENYNKTIDSETIEELDLTIDWT